jgi:hypothetical protein
MCLRFFVLLPPGWRIRQQNFQLRFHIGYSFWFIAAAELTARWGLIVSLFLFGYVWFLILFCAYFCWQGRSFISILMLTTLGLSKAKANISPIFWRALFCLLESIILYGFFGHSAMGLKQALSASGVTIGDWLRRWESTHRVQGKDHDRIANSSRVILLGGSGSLV